MEHVVERFDGDVQRDGENGVRGDLPVHPGVVVLSVVFAYGHSLPDAVSSLPQ